MACCSSLIETSLAMAVMPTVLPSTALAVEADLPWLQPMIDRHKHAVGTHTGMPTNVLGEPTCSMFDRSIKREIVIG